MTGIVGLLSCRKPRTGISIRSRRPENLSLHCVLAGTKTSRLEVSVERLAPPHLLRKQVMASELDIEVDSRSAQPTDRGAPVIRTVAMPADTNPAGDVFGGWLMAQMDLAAGNIAAR